MRAIFISYRRSDSEGEAGRLFDELVGRFSDKAVFMDVDAIAPGRDFRKAIEESIHSCSVLLAMIGPQWLGSVDAAGGMRLEDAGDYLRLEIASALRRDIPVVPVLVRGAKMPRAEQLPAELQELAYRNGVELTHVRWRSDMQVLVKALAPYLDSVEQRPEGAEQMAAAPVPAASPAAVGVENDSALIERVSRELARSIGPVAEVVVKRAARRCGSPTELIDKVAQEIESVPERAGFVERCRP